MTNLSYNLYSGHLNPLHPSLTPSPSGNHLCVLCIHVFCLVIFVPLFCFLGCTNKWKHIVFVFLSHNFEILVSEYERDCTGFYHQITSTLRKLTTGLCCQWVLISYMSWILLKIGNLFLRQIPVTLKQ